VRPSTHSNDHRDVRIAAASSKEVRQREMLRTVS
jgi:hypothetical protein